MKLTTQFVRISGFVCTVSFYSCALNVAVQIETDSEG